MFSHAKLLLVSSPSSVTTRSIHPALLFNQHADSPSEGTNLSQPKYNATLLTLTSVCVCAQTVNSYLILGFFISIPAVPSSVHPSVELQKLLKLTKQEKEAGFFGLP